jgi:hypothetical protein
MHCRGGRAVWVRVGLSVVRPVPGAKAKQKPGRSLLE